MQAYRNQDAFEEYMPAWKELVRLIGELSEMERPAREHGEVESYIGERGQDVMRLLLQGYLDRLSTEEEPSEGVVGPQEQVRRYARERRRGLMSVFGPVQ